MKKFYFLILFALCTQLVYAQAIRRAKVGGTGDGSTWALAGDLQSMINNSAEGDLVWVASGTYYPTEKIAATDAAAVATTERDQAFILRNGVKVYGGFAGTETALAERDFAANPTILSGDLGTAGSNTDNAYHVVTARINSPSQKAILDGFTIQDGYGNVSTSVTAGFALSRNQGAAINLRGTDATANLELTNLIVKNNETTSSGGAIYANISGSGTLLLTNVQFNNNKASGGGAIYLLLGTGDPNVTITNAVFSGNQTTTHSGALYTSNNSAGILKLTNAKFLTNEAKGGLGGAIYQVNGFMQIYNSVFAGNKASTSGGAVYVGSAATVMATGSIINSTFYQNTASSGSGGGFSFFANATAATVNLYNNIFNANTASDGSNDVRSATSGILKFKNNLFQVYALTAGVDDEFSANIVNAAPTPLFMSTSSADLNFLQLVEGAATEKGNNGLYNGATTDLAGNTRTKHTYIDLGAYEYQGVLPVELLYFTAVPNGNASLLSWQTATEKNNQKFTIERGTSPTNFTLIKEVTAVGNSSAPQLYSYADRTPLSGTNYYRLTQYDNDGTATVLGLKSVNFSLAKTQTKIYPNPATETVAIKLTAPFADAVTVNLISLVGKNVLTKSFSSAEIQQELTLNLKSVPTGTYILWINKGKAGSEKQTLLVVK